MESARSPTAEPDVAERILGLLPARLRGPVEWSLSRWPGRIGLRSAASCIRIELFDRSMTIAGQFFTSVFPILVTVAVWFGSNDSNRIADALNMPEQSRNVLDEALDTPTAASFGVISVLIVLISATSLSRALTRAVAAIWTLERPKSTLASAWRWLAAVLTLALSLVVVRSLGSFLKDVPPPVLWRAVAAFAVDVAMATFVPWILISGAVPPRRLLPGAVLFAAVMMAVRPASAIWLPHALDVSANRYGSIGVAFTYLAWLYVVSFCFLATAVLGQVITTDSGWLGRFIRGEPRMSNLDAALPRAGAAHPLDEAGADEHSHRDRDDRQ
jgi:membrane protein